MSPRSSRTLAVAWLVMLAYATVYAWLTAWSYARIGFTTDLRERATTVSNCGNTSPDCAALVHAQVSAMDHVALVVRGTAAVITVADVVLLVIATVAALTGRLLRVAWVVQAVVTVLLFGVYAVLLYRGHAVRDDMPPIARMPTFEAAFGTPLIDFGVLYYAGWFVVANVAMLLVLRSLSAPGRPAPAR